jgi:hypothetical protein
VFGSMTGIPMEEVTIADHPGTKPTFLQKAKESLGEGR